MKKAAVITKVEMISNGEYTVTYESGARRTYKMDRLPKTVKSFIDAQNADPFFKDEASKVIFFLLYGEGELRTSTLGITVELYKNQELAKTWYRDMVKLVHPDNCSHPLAAKAFMEVNRIHKRMVK